LNTICPASGRAKSGKRRGRDEEISFLILFFPRDCDGGGIVNELDVLEAPATTVEALRPPSSSFVPVSRFRGRMGGAGMVFEVLQCRQV